MHKLMISLRGEPEQLAFLPEIVTLGAGIELGSYGLVGIRSAQDWQQRVTWHRALRKQFDGPLALHGPFLGMEFAHPDHLIRDAVAQRMDLTFAAATELRASRVILHSGYTADMDHFKLQEVWLQGCTAYWQREIERWAAAGIEIVLENDTDKVPDGMVRLVENIAHPALGLCFDTGHQHMFSTLDASTWVQRMGARLYHVHLHDNDRSGDKHWPIGRGTIDFNAFFAALSVHAPDATLCIEVEDTLPVKIASLQAVKVAVGL